MLEQTLILFYTWFTVAAAAPAITPATDDVPTRLYPTIEASVDRNVMRIGDVFHLTVTLTHDPSVTILQHGKDLDLGQFEIKDINFGVTESLPNGKQQRKIDYTLSTYFTGEFEIPSFSIRFQTGAGQIGEVRTPPIKINVESLTPEESENLDIRDIKPQVVLEGQSRLWMILTACAVIILLALLAYYLRRRLQNKGLGVSLEPPLTPQERALRDLAALRADRSLFDNKRYKEFSTRVSEIMRVYIQGRWNINALDETSNEILYELERISVSKEALQKFCYFFDDCDLIKFAKHEPTVEDMDSLITLAETLVNETAPQPETPPSLSSQPQSAPEEKQEIPTAEVSG